MQITEVFECHNKTVTRQSSSQRKSRRLSGKLHCLNFVFPAENETLGPVCLGCEASSSSVSLSMLKVPIQIRQLINDIKCASALADCVTLCRSASLRYGDYGLRLRLNMILSVRTTGIPIFTLTLSSYFGSPLIAHQCCDQLTAVKAGYPLTSIT